MRIKSFALALVAAASCAVSAHATPIMYSITSYDTGTLDGKAFSNALVTFTYFGDTNFVVNTGTSFVEAVGVTGVNVQGVGTALLTDSTFFFVDNSTTAAGIYDTTINASVDLFNSEFMNYYGTTSLGPLVGTYYFSPTPTFKTTMGTLSLTSSFNTVGAFQAQVVTPEPSSLLLLSSGISSLAVLVRRRKRLA